LGPKLLPPRTLPFAQLRLLPLQCNLFELLHNTLGGLLLHKGAGAVDPPGPLPLPLPLAQLMLMQYFLLGLMHQFPAVQGCRSNWCTRPLPLLLPPLPLMQLLPLQLSLSQRYGTVSLFRVLLHNGDGAVGTPGLLLLPPPPLPLAQLLLLLLLLLLPLQRHLFELLHQTLESLLLHKGTRVGGAPGTHSRPAHTSANRNPTVTHAHTLRL
jgi:hypothetical protein